MNTEYTWGAPEHLAWLDRHREWMLSFYEPHVVDPEGGYFWLGDRGLPKPEMGKGLWMTARMIHCFSLASLAGRDGATAIAEHGVRHLLGAGRDQLHGGWYAHVGQQGRDEHKELYGLAHVVLAGSSALTSGIPGGAALLSEAIELIEGHYWNESDGACLDVMDRAFTVADPYRGMNANMHLTEAFLAAYEATGERRLLERALRLAERFAKAPVTEGGSTGYRLVEHFDHTWQPLPDYNREEPAHPFRPYGTTPGHWLEWAKLCIQLHGLLPEVDWLVPVARTLFEGAVADAWADNGGFHYTLDWDGSVVISNRYFWPVTEGIGAAHLLRLATGDEAYAQWYGRLWEFADAHLVDHEHGSWHSELDDDLRPIKLTWDGKPDLYHVMQATLYAQLPLDRGLAAQLAVQRGG